MSFNYLDKMNRNYLHDLEDNGVNIREMAVEFISKQTGLPENMIDCKIFNEKEVEGSKVYTLYDSRKSDVVSELHIFGEFDYLKADQNYTAQTNHININTDWIGMVYSKIREVFGERVAEGYIMDADKSVFYQAGKMHRSIEENYKSDLVVARIRKDQEESKLNAQMDNFAKFFSAFYKDNTVEM